MIPVWPSELPRPSRSGWQAQRQEARLRRQAETGPPAYRRRFSAVARIVILSILVSRELKGVFDRFHLDQVQDGTLPFWMPDPSTEGWALLGADGAPLITDAGAPILTAARWLVLFGDQQPVETILGVEFRIDFSVAVMP